MFAVAPITTTTTNTVMTGSHWLKVAHIYTFSIMYSIGVFD